MDKETADALRGMIRRVTLKTVNDEGEMQTASVEVADGIVREDVEVAQPYGFGSNPPVDGALGIMIAIGGDQGDAVILPTGNPSARMGKLPKGAVGVSNANGDKVVVQPNGTIDIASAGAIVLKVGGCSLTISADGFAFAGGAITHDGVVIDKTHGHVSAPPGAPGPPVGG
ncbi:phage baseplate assembly protein V [Shinella sp. HZN7]|uniref:phage baseplate assembly protein V n=1 Tax=Shinella sp. (strain HZN7) TaxID=879274 RepID=UPI0007DA74A5|nr:phage baseplate assembly protein [Shinella sp. HZN7]ANH04598.1 hypothetical protein shn_11490 [Shinella sp. HZN7]